jgi:hypothetical protein
MRIISYNSGNNSGYNSGNKEVREIIKKSKPSKPPSVLNTSTLIAANISNMVNNVKFEASENENDMPVSTNASQVSAQRPGSTAPVPVPLSSSHIPVINPVKNPPPPRSESAAPSQGGKHKRKHRHTRRSNKKQNKRTRRNRK